MGLCPLPRVIKSLNTLIHDYYNFMLVMITPKQFFIRVSKEFIIKNNVISKVLKSN